MVYATAFFAVNYASLKCDTTTALNMSRYKDVARAGANVINKFQHGELLQSEIKHSDWMSQVT